MKETNNQISDGKVQDLIHLIESSPSNFKHLQVFLHRERGTKSRPDNFFLMVTPRVFGKVEVLDLNVEGDYIIVEFLDCTLQEVGNIRININDEKPSTLFICWQDIMKMVLNDFDTSSTN